MHSSRCFTADGGAGSRRVCEKGTKIFWWYTKIEEVDIAIAIIVHMIVEIGITCCGTKSQRKRNQIEEVGGAVIIVIKITDVAESIIVCIRL